MNATVATTDHPEPRLPLLVLIGGAPAAGKTTLAGHLGRALGLPVLLRDTIKETLLDTLGAADRAQSAALGRASYAVLYAVAQALLVAPTGVILESNFHRGIAERELAPLITGARAVQVLCQTSRAEIARRYATRAARGQRHAGHFDAQMLDTVLANLDAGHFAPLELGIPVIAVDTTIEYRPPLVEIAARINQIAYGGS